MKEIKVEIPYEERVSRLFVFRFLWMFVLLIPTYVLGVWAMLNLVFNFFHMLVLGKRHQGSWDRTRKYFSWGMSWNTYFLNLNDYRPKFWW